ncbi:vitamin B12 ABC transporter permease BtuC [Haloarcula onubensis]|uniref:Vitamin B12 ABC transporter permease BtuC n=1 Tax=Haloarcula onubensis TaxID=2950539 RepID=A0ABU2FSC4_9EURY|nr:vitamin B12 ABC transporter permease BtuC [Halomicroarcula sp. S3CR25-11]MDS0283660.1 vitamin B12 ABC transporter permease BtuC [Halomicroarcula sp. S3CR25-11]
MRTSGRTAAWSLALSALLVAVVTVSAGIGPVWIPPADVAQVLLNAVAVPTAVDISGAAVDVTTASVFRFRVSPIQRRIVMGIRLPRILLGAVVGFALAAAGTIMQGIFRNPMADPSIIGVSSGAAVGAVGFIVAGASLPFGLGLRAAAFAGALVAAFGVYLIATENGRTPVATLLLAGVAVQTFLGAVVSFLLLNAGESIRRALFWLMGHLKGAAWPEVWTSLLLVAIPFALLLVYARDLNVMLLGEEDAQSLGVEVERTKRVLLALASFATAAGVAVAGIIGFVGLIVPHVMRLLVGPDHRVLLPTSALAGASFLVATDTLARSGSAELPVGIVTAALGAPFFLYLLRKREVHEL